MVETFSPPRLEAAPTDASLDLAVTSLYAALRRMARRTLARYERSDSLQPTGLVHEAYLGLRDQRCLDAGDRGELLGVAALLMRRVLADRARSRQRLKRGGSHACVSLDDSPLEPERSDAGDEELLAVDEALERLGRMDPRKARVVELLFFGGLTLAETARELGVSLNTVKRDWTFAKLWILREAQSSAVGA